MKCPRKVLLAVFLTVLILCFIYNLFIKQRPDKSLFYDYSMSASGKVWTITGAINSDNEAFIDQSGAFQPGKGRYSIHYYLYDNDSHKLLNPPDTEKYRHLLCGYMPAPIVCWTASNLQVAITTFASYAGTSPDDLCFSSVRLENKSKKRKNVSLFAVVVPYGIIGRLPGSEDISFDEKINAIKTNGNIQLICDCRPDNFGADSSEISDNSGYSDITSYIVSGRLPGIQYAKSNARVITSGAVRYDLSLAFGSKKTISFRSPFRLLHSINSASILKNEDYKEAENSFIKQWDDELSHVKLQLPDGRYSDCFFASLAYLMVLSDKGIPKPGASCYDAFWTRDFAYISDAMYYAGRIDLSKPGINYLAGLECNGVFPARSGSGDEENDSNGQAIYTLIQYYKRTGDKKWLQSVWPSIRRSAVHIHNLQKTGENAILPASLSAEDIGKPNQQHYWDDYWALRGLKDAEFAANELKISADARMFSEYYNSFDKCLLTNIKDAIKKNSINYIPNGPEDIFSSSMARGTSCALWPCNIFELNNSLVRSSFDVYWDKWIRPHNGGFEHQHQFWPYAGLDLANGYLMLGESEHAAEILRWTINHDPSKGFYAWCEGMNTKDLTNAMGDMPHGWFCASYISLLRNMLVRESGNTLMIASGVPTEWLSAGKSIKISDFPTKFGQVCYQIMSEENVIKINFHADSNKHNTICNIKLPTDITVEKIDINGKYATSHTPHSVCFPINTRNVYIQISRKK